MLKPVVDFTRQLLSVTRDVQQLKEEVKALRQELKEMRQDDTQLRQDMNQQRLEFAELTRMVERLVYEVQGTRENAEAEKKDAAAGNGKHTIAS